MQRNPFYISDKKLQHIHKLIQINHVNVAIENPRENVKQLQKFKLKKERKKKKNLLEPGNQWF